MRALRCTNEALPSPRTLRETSPLRRVELAQHCERVRVCVCVCAGVCVCACDRAHSESVARTAKQSAARTHTQAKPLNASARTHSCARSLGRSLLLRAAAASSLVRLRTRLAANLGAPTKPSSRAVQLALRDYSAAAATAAATNDKTASALSLAARLGSSCAARSSPAAECGNNERCSSAGAQTQRPLAICWLPLRVAHEHHCPCTSRGRQTRTTGLNDRRRPPLLGPLLASVAAAPD